MTSNPNASDQLDERAFLLFLQEGLKNLLERSTALRRNDVLTFSSWLYNEWSQLSPNRKDLYIEQARITQEQAEQRSFLDTIIDRAQR
jgi:hypothetical protein